METQSERMKLPLGIRNNNPGNIEWGDPWQGLVPYHERTDVRFCQFETPIDGIRAIARTLITYQDKRLARDGSRIDTIYEIVERWAPPEDSNPTAAYARGLADLLHVCKHDEVIDVHDYDMMRPIVEGIIRHENGKGPLKTINTWYPDDVIDEALRRAGVVPRKPERRVKPEDAAGVTVAGGTGYVGVDMTADAVRDLQAAIQSSDSFLNSGTVIGAVVGVALIAVSGYFIYRRYRSVTLGV